MELGTGVYAGRSPHRPPAAALENWARKHGTTGYAVARAIAMAGGLKPRRYLQRAFEQNLDKIQAIIGNGIKGIVNR